MSGNRMPVVFAGHGSPMNAIEDNEFSRTWEQLGRELPRPTAIVCISAHWETPKPQVTAMQQPETIHDFYGFPRPLAEYQYPAPGSPQLAGRVQQVIGAAGVDLTHTWGLDHGAWSVLCRMFPRADIPVVQLSLDRTRDGQTHYDLGRQLLPLRDEGVLILGSGNMVHNLRLIDWEDHPLDWALEFDRQLEGWMAAGDHAPIIHFEEQGQAARLSINSGEHYLPLLYILALQQKNEPLRFFNEKISLGSLSMRGVVIG